MIMCPGLRRACFGSPAVAFCYNEVVGAVRDIRTEDAGLGRVLAVADALALARVRPKLSVPAGVLFRPAAYKSC
jgi:hypothetical protein